MISGLLAGSLTSTPAFSATKEAVAAQYQDAVTVGYGIAYLFGVIGVVLFVQLMPRVVHADLDEERRKITHVETGDVAKFKGKLLEFDDFGFTPFAVAAVFGILLGSVKFFNFFSLTTTAARCSSRWCSATSATSAAPISCRARRCSKRSGSLASWSSSSAQAFPAA